MANIHYFQRYSSIENTVTNNTLQLLARIYNYSSSQASKLLTELTGETIEIGIEINQQKRSQDSIPDGAIIQRSFKILIEAKVDAGVDIAQLARHAKHFSDESKKILILLTKERVDKTTAESIRHSISQIDSSVVFTNITYEDICKAIRGLFKDYEYEIVPLVEDYEQYCNDSNLFDQSKYLLRIVLCGQSIELNKRYGIYFHASDRGYTRHSYIGIYANKAVRSIFLIDSVFDVEFDGVTLKKELVEGKYTDEYDDKLIAIINDAKVSCGYEVASGHRFFCGQPKDTHFEKSSPGGLLGWRYTNLRDTIGRFSDAEDVAAQLRGKSWT